VPARAQNARILADHFNIREQEIGFLKIGLGVIVSNNKSKVESQSNSQSTH
jgi:hypothetical protein